VAEAHGRGIRVLLDFVSNHVHQDHPWVKQHPDWFSKLELPDGRLNLRIWDEHRLTTWFEPYMPDIAYDKSPQAIGAFCDAAIHWLKTYDLDGFRHDAVKHVPREFWQELTRRIRTDPELKGRELYQIGETFGSDELILSYVGPDVLDAQFNFNLFHPVRALFLDEGRPFGELADLLEQNLRVYGRNNRMGTLIDSHDKARFAIYADGDMPLEGVSETEAGWAQHHEVDDPATWDKQALFLCYLLTTPGVPFLYYGDEIGMTGAGDPDNRRMMRFEPDLKDGERRLKERVELYCRARGERPELRRGDLEFLLADAEVVAYLRSAEKADGRPSRSLVWLNRSGVLQTRTVTLPLGLGERRVDLQPWEGAIQIVE
jgi:cyclomaltodextrinase